MEGRDKKLYMVTLKNGTKQWSAVSDTIALAILKKEIPLLTESDVVLKKQATPEKSPNVVEQEVLVPQKKASKPDDKMSTIPELPKKEPKKRVPKQKEAEKEEPAKEPKKRGPKPKKEKDTTTKGKSAQKMFVDEIMPKLKAEQPGLPLEDYIKMASEQWKKAQKN
jgi:hypothetical protein